MTELLALLGRAAPRLLVWPGGLALALLALGLIRARRAGDALADAGGYRLALAACAMPLLALALLPLPLSAPADRDCDLILVLALLECPQWLLLAATLAQGERRRVASALAALLNGYPLLLLAGLAMASGSASLNLAALAAGPAPAASVGGVAWVLALAPLFGARLPAAGALLELAGRLRRLGHVALAAVLLAPAIAPAQPEWLAGWPSLVLALAAAGALLGLGRLLQSAIGRYYAPLLAWSLLAWLGWQAFLAALHI